MAEPAFFAFPAEEEQPVQSVEISRHLMLRRGGDLGQQAGPVFTMEVVNSSGGALARGDVVVWDKTNSTAQAINVTTTTTVDNPDVIGMVWSATIASGASGYVQWWGPTAYLKVDGTTDIAKGDYLGSFSTAKIAAKTVVAPFARAMEAYTADDSLGVITAFISCTGIALSPLARAEVGEFADGTVGVPSITFASDIDSGFYRIGANNVGATVNGAKVLDIGTAGLGVTGTLTPSGQILAAAGTVSLPGVAISGDPDSGFYRVSANKVAVAAQGAAILTLDGSVANSATGLSVTSAASGSGVALAATGGTNEALTLDAKGSGTITLGSVSTGNILLSRAVVMSSTASLTGLTFTTSAASATALATPSAYAATQFAAFASTVSGASVMGFGTTNDVTLMNRAGTVVLGVTANTTGITMAGALAITGALSGVTTMVASSTVTASGLSLVGAGAVILGTTGGGYIAIQPHTGGFFITKQDGSFNNVAVTDAGVMTVRSGFTLTTTAPLTFGEGGNIVAGTATGTKIGTATSQLLGFYNATPIAQRAGAAQAAVVTTASTLTTPYGYATQAQADAIVALVNELRAWAVAQGFIKGSA